MATDLEEGKFWIQTYFTQLKFDIVSYPAHAKGLVKRMLELVYPLIY